MYATLTLVDLAGAVALLIWGVHMVQTGVNRAFGPQLRRILSYALGNRFKAFARGPGGHRHPAEQHGHRTDGHAPSRPAGSSISSRRWPSCSAPMSARR